MQLFKHNNLINDIDVSKINNINNVVFETTKSVYSVDDVISKRIRDEISDKEYDKIIESFKPSCQMKNLADNNVVLYRFAKSNTSVAERSIEGHDCIKHNEYQIAKAINTSIGLSMTTANYLLNCISYGDIVAEVVFDRNELEKSGIANEKVYHINNSFNEYVSNQIMIGKMYNLSDARTLAAIITISDNKTLENAIITPKEYKHSVPYALKNFNCDNSLRYWNNIVSRYNELDKNNCESKIDTLKLEAIKILNETEITDKDTEFNIDDLVLQYNDASLNQNNLSLYHDDIPEI